MPSRHHRERRLPSVFTFYQRQTHRPPTDEAEAVEPSNDELPQPLFETTSPYAVHRLPHWIVHNMPLGKGTFGEVHLATHERASWLQVACKSLKATRGSSLAKSLTEVKVLIAFNHPNVNTILDIVDEPPTETHVGRTHLILELMAGGDLFAYVEKHHSLPEMEVKWLAYQLVKGLKYIHEQKVAHRGELSTQVWLTARHQAREHLPRSLQCLPSCRHRGLWPCHHAGRGFRADARE